jgi:FkbM family methyltransferase
VNLYGQDAELSLLCAFIARLDHRWMIDVGAERGSLATAMLEAGVEGLHAFDPHPDNVATLREQFGGDARVVVHECAVSDGDGSAELHVSSAPNGSPLPFGHTLLERADTDEIAWRQTVTVSRRSLASLIDAGEIPGRVGILKIDTEGHDLAVVRGMGALDADVVMVEYWNETPHGLGRCPWTAEDLLSELRPRGFAHFAFIVHRGEFVTLKWDDAEVEPGWVGNLIFIHERVIDDLLPDVIDAASRLAEDAVQVGQMYMHAAWERLAVLNELKEALDARSQALAEATAALAVRDGEVAALRNS